MATPTPSLNHLITAMRDSQIGNTASLQDADILSACEKVINTVELLDAILLDIVARRGRPKDSSIPRGTLRLSRVNRAFYNHIHGDTDISQQLFLAPKANHSKLSCVLKDFGLARRNTCGVECMKLGLDSPILGCVSFSISCYQIKHQIQSWAMRSWSEMLLTQPPITEILGGNPPSHSARSAPPRWGHQVERSDGDGDGVV